MLFAYSCISVVIQFGNVQLMLSVDQVTVAFYHTTAMGGKASVDAVRIKGAARGVLHMLRHTGCGAGLRNFVRCGGSDSPSKHFLGCPLCIRTRLIVLRRRKRRLDEPAPRTCQL